MKLVLTWPAFATTVGFEVQERLLPADNASWSLTMGIAPTFLSDMRKV